MNKTTRYTVIGGALLSMIFFIAANAAIAEGLNEQTSEGSWDVQGAFGDQARMHNNQGTGNNAEYDFDHPNLPTAEYRFTGDAVMNKTVKGTQQKAIQGMVRDSGGGRLMTETGILAPHDGASLKSFAGPSSFGFQGAQGGFYNTIYQGQSVAGNFLPGTGTGQLAVNILDEEQFPQGQFLKVPAAPRMQTLRAYIATGGKISRGSLSDEEAAELNIGKGDYYEDSDF